MRRLLYSSLLALAVGEVWGASAPPDAPPLPPPFACRDPQASADYVPGVDAQGNPVTPADLPGTADIEVSTQILGEFLTRNRQMPRVGVDVNLKGLETLPPCPPPPVPGALPVPRQR
jgi:hypothetical protein